MPQDLLHGAQVGAVRFFYDETDPALTRQAVQDAHATVDYAEVRTFSLKKYNDFLVFYFGPQVRQLQPSDFDTIASAYAKGLPIFTGEVSESNLRAYDAGDGDTMFYFPTDTCIGTSTSYIYDVKESGGDYYVYTVNAADPYGDTRSFHAYEEDILRLSGIRADAEYLVNNVYVFGKHGGNVYLKRIERHCLFADPAFLDYEVVAEQVDLTPYYVPHLEDYAQTPLPHGTHVAIVSENIEKETVYFVCPEGFGRTKKENLAPLHSETTR